MRMVRLICALLLLTVTCLAQSAASRASAAMVTIRGTAENGNPVSGTGFVVASNGTIVTNLHLVKGLTNAHVELATGDIFDAFTLVGADTRRDLAIIRIAGFDLPCIALGNSNSVRSGDKVVLVGNGGSASNASVSGTAVAEGFRLIQTSAAAGVGASGGVLLSASGEAIGVLGYRSNSATSVAVPINYARGLLDSPSEVADRSAGLSPVTPTPESRPLSTEHSALSADRSAGVSPVTPTPESHPLSTEHAAPSADRSAGVSPATPTPESHPLSTEHSALSADRSPGVSPVTPASDSERSTTRPPEFARPSVRKIYIGSLGSGEGPDMLRDKIAHHLQESNFEVVDSPGQADAIFSGSGKWDHVRVQRFSARLVTGDERVLWSGEVSSGGWIRSASTSVANKLVDQMIRGLANAGPQ